MVDPMRAREKERRKNHSEKNSKNNQQININKVTLDVGLLLSGETESV
jgi:hypothetical protein